MSLPNWIAPDGTIEAGTFVVNAPLVVPPGYRIRGQGQDRTFIAGGHSTAPTVLLSGILSGVSVSGGTRCVEIPNSARGATLADCLLSQCTEVPLYVGACVGARIMRCTILDSLDNGLQTEGGSDLLVHSCAIVGRFGNKAFDASHGSPIRMALVHLTIVAMNGYGVGLAGWRVGAENSMVNCAIFAPKPGPGANGFGILLPNAFFDGRFVGNVVQGDLYGSQLADGTLVHAPRVYSDAIDQNGFLDLDLPHYRSDLPVAQRLKPARIRRMFSGSWRTVGSQDLNGETRFPWRGAIAVGAVATA